MNKIMERKIAGPTPMGSYPPDDVTFLLKDLSSFEIEEETEEREEATNFAEVLTPEYEPSEHYMKLFFITLREQAENVALAVGTVSELILQQHGKQTVLASLRRSGTPIGILVKRYLKIIHNVELPHYSISLFRSKGLDENALIYMLQQHPDYHIQFVDGWTGKGAARKILIQSIAAFNAAYRTNLTDDLAVLTDPGQCVATYGTREDFLIPSAFLNATVNGLVSKAIIRDDLIGSEDFHGAKFYRHWAEQDVSNVFVDTVSSKFANVADKAKQKADHLSENPQLLTESWKGLQDIREIGQRFDVDNMNLIKPGVGEVTKILLKRLPWKILVDRMDNPYLNHILLLAQERGVPVETYPNLSFACCAVIKE